MKFHHDRRTYKTSIMTDVRIRRGEKKTSIMTDVRIRRGEKKTTGMGMGMKKKK